MSDLLPYLLSFVIGAAVAALLNWSRRRASCRLALTALLFEETLIVDELERFGIEYPYLTAKELRDRGLIEGNQVVSLTKAGRLVAVVGL